MKILNWLAIEFGKTFLWCLGAVVLLAAVFILPGMLGDLAWPVGIFATILVVVFVYEEMVN